MPALTTSNDFQDVFFCDEKIKKAAEDFKRACLKNKTFTRLNKQQSFYGVIYYRARR